MEFNWLTNPLMLAIGIVLGRLTDIIKFIDSIIGLSQRRTKSTDIYKIENTNLMKTSNPRFGFSFVEPRTWDRSDPLNGDGNSYSHPTKTNVSYSVSGMYDVFDDGDTYASVKRKLVVLKEKKKFRLLVDRQCGSYQIDYPNKTSINLEQISAWRLKYQYKESGNNITVIEFICNYKGVCFTVQGKANSKDFEKYEDFFIFLISEFKILGEHSAPFARGIEQSKS
jgi:hypothetical protein